MKKKSLLIFLLSSLWFLCSAQAVWNNTSFVHQNNKQIMDGQGNAIHLDGVNLGGWLLWEGWIWGGGYTQEKNIYNNIKSIVGTSSADAFRDSIHHNFITRGDIQKISQECYNVVRIPFNHTLLEDDLAPYTYKPEGWTILDSVLKWCEDYNVYAILDLHSAPGGQSGSFTADPDLINLWNGSINQNRTRKLWQAIANRYKNRGIIAGYDLLNEPNTSTDANMLNLYTDIIDSVRAVDPNHMLFIEGNSFATDFTMFSSLPDPNMCFQFHFYTWFFSSAIATHLSTYTNLSNNLNVPVWCGEWGENDYTELDTTLTLLRDPSFNISGNAFWTWKKMKDGNTYTYYNGVDSTTEWTKTIKWISNTSMPTPTAVEMQTALNAFVQNVRIQNCAFNDTLSDMLNACAPTMVPISKSAENIVVYPDPFSNSITIEGLNINKPITILLYNSTGQIVLKMNINNPREGIDLSSLPTGIYLIQGSSGSAHLFEKKIIKISAN